jgi:hypothetical protein
MVASNGAGAATLSLVVDVAVEVAEADDALLVDALLVTAVFVGELLLSVGVALAIAAESAVDEDVVGSVVTMSSPAGTPKASPG